MELAGGGFFVPWSGCYWCLVFGVWGVVCAVCGVWGLVYRVWGARGRRLLGPLVCGLSSCIRINSVIYMTMGRCPLSIFCSRGTPPLVFGVWCLGVGGVGCGTWVVGLGV